MQNLPAQARKNRKGSDGSPNSTLSHKTQLDSLKTLQEGGGNNSTNLEHKNFLNQTTANKWTQLPGRDKAIKMMLFSFF